MAVKLGGLAMVFPGVASFRSDPPTSSEALAAQWKPYLETCIEAFGPERGLVTAVHPAAALHAAASAYAARLAAGPTRADAMTKRALLAGQTSSYADALALEAELQVEAGRMQDHRGAVAAFLRKEKPTFEGR